MSTISGVGGGGGWAAYGPPDASAMKQRMFNKADADGSGGIDASELKAALAKLSEDSGQDLGDAEETLAKWDSDGDGSLNADEMDTGMKSLMPAPSSTVDFAQRRGGPDGMPPPPPDGADGSAGGGSTTGSAGTAATQLQKLVEQLAQAMDSDGDQTISADEVSGFLQQLSQRVDTTA